MEAKVAMRLGVAKVGRGLVLAALVWGAGQRRLAAATPVSENVAAELTKLGQTAGSIFVGQITAIDRQPGFVAVTFHVEQTVRGAAAEEVILREWAGQWAPGQFRYQVGQRVLAFLHTASSAGFSSPVHGPEGLVPVVVQGADAPQLLDIRRIAASVVRSPGTPLPTDQSAAVALDDALDLLAGRGSADVALRSLPVRGAPPSSALERLVTDPSTRAGYGRAPLTAPVLRRSSDVRR